MKFLRIFSCITFLLFGNSYVYSQELSNRSSKVEIKSKIDSLSDECWRLREIDTDTSIKIGEEAISLAKTYNIKESLPRLNNYVGAVYSNYHYDSETALKYFHKALELGTQLKDSTEIGWAYNNLGDTYLTSGNNALALDYSKKSFVIFKKINNPMGIAHGYRNFGLVYQSENNYDQAISSFNNAKKYHKEIGDIKGIALSLFELAEAYNGKKHYKTADSLYKESYSYYQSINNVRLSARCLSGQASVYYKLNEFEKAKEYYKEAIELNIQKDYNYGLVDNYIGISMIYASENNKEEGELYLKKATEISVDNHVDRKIILKNQKAKITFYQILGDFKMASDSYNEFLNKYDSIYSLQQFETLNEIREKFTISQNLITQKLENESLKKEEQLFLIIVGLLIFIVLISFYLIYKQRKLNKKLRKINRTKEKMFSVISHDLKSPFNLLLGFSDLILENIKKNNYRDIEKYTKIINQTSKRSLKLLENLLNWSRSQSGTIKYNPQSILLKNIFGDLNDFFEEDSKNYNVELQFTDSISESITGDKNLIFTVLMNLISNSLKYTPDGGKIEVKATKKAFSIIIEVIDNGTGISEERLKTLFDKAIKVESKPGIRNEKGTGLGLAICSEFIEIQKGKISVSSELGKGSNFAIKIPA